MVDLFLLPARLHVRLPDRDHRALGLLRAVPRPRHRGARASTDSVHSHWAWLNTPREKNGIAGTAYPLVADFTKEIARAYGVLDEATGAAQRGLFIIDPEGVLRYAVVTADNVGRSSEETMRVLEALQTGGLCPADWTPGKQLLTVGV